MEDRFQIHLFTAEHPVEQESGWLTRFFDAGLDCLHLRRPSYDSSSLETLIRAIPGRYHSRIVIHDHYDLAQKYDCGVQLNSRNHIPDRQPTALSRSCHSLAEVSRCSRLDFVTLSTVFDSISKPSYPSRFSHAELIEADLSNVIALGGVSVDNISILKGLGFAGAALLGDVWSRPDGERIFLKHLLMRNFSLQFITDGKDIEETVRQALTVLDGGCRWVQVRMKNSDIGEIRETLQELYPHCVDRRATLIVDDHFELIDLCHGVHLGQSDTPVAEVRSQISSEKTIGLTVNNEDHISASLSALPDYYGVGPFRFTSTKKKLSPVLGIEGYRRLAPILPRKFVAIGGIRPDDIPSLLQAGASGIAVSSLITLSDDPCQQTKNLIQMINGK